MVHPTWSLLLLSVLFDSICTPVLSTLVTGASTYIVPTQSVRTQHSFSRDSGSTVTFRSYDVYIPSTYTNDQSWPLVFYFHPYGASCSLYKAAAQCLHDNGLPIIPSTYSTAPSTLPAERITSPSVPTTHDEYTTLLSSAWKGNPDPTLCELVTYAETHSYILVSLCGNQQAWKAGSCCSTNNNEDDKGNSSDSTTTAHIPAGDDSEFLRTVLDDITQYRSVSIDHQRVWSIGFSNGGMMSHLMACEQPNFVRASVSVSGTLAPFFTRNISTIVTTQTEIIADAPITQVVLPSIHDICRVTQDQRGTASSHRVSVLEIHGGNDVSLPLEGYLDSVVGLSSLTQTMDTHAEFAQCSRTTTDKTKNSILSVSSSSSYEPILQWQRHNHTIQSYIYTSCTNGSRIEYVVVQNGGHEWFTQEYHKFDTSEYIIHWLETVSNQQYGNRSIQNHQQKRLTNYIVAYKDTLYKVRLSYRNSLSIFPTEENSVFTTDTDIDKDILHLNEFRQAVLPVSYQNLYTYNNQTHTFTTKPKPGTNQFMDYDEDTGIDLELAKDMEQLGDLFVELSRSTEDSSKDYDDDYDDEDNYFYDGEEEEEEDNDFDDFEEEDKF